MCINHFSSGNYYLRISSKNLVGWCILFSSFGLFLSVFLSCESRKVSENKATANSPPTVTSVSILPEKPHIESELNLIMQGNGPGGGPIAYKYQWIKNSQEIEGENNISLKSGRFRKGDLIQVRVIPTAGKMEGPSFLSPQVKILNSPPVIQEVWIEPKVAFVNDNLKANVKSLDTDGDFVYYAFQWEKNGQVIPEERGQVLERGRFRKGDSIVVTVAPDDREIEGTQKKSASVVLSNSPPSITSNPPTSVAGATYQYQVIALDPDQDPITFTLKAGPKGMVMDKNTGLIQWGVQKEDSGTHSVEIEATDNEGAKSIQRFSLRVDFK